MHLHEGEKIVQIYRHHPTPFIFQVFFTLLGTLPFILVLFLFKESFSSGGFFIAHVVIFAVFALIVAYLSLIYWLDKLVLTNHRAIMVDWKSLSRRDESEVNYHEIQEIQTQEQGFWSYFKAFDYGSIALETASSHIVMEFLDAPDPESIRRHIYQIRTASNDSK